MIPFSPPKITQEIIDEVVDSLKSGWITTGPKVKKLEDEVAKFSGVQHTVCLNSATAGLELMLRWFGVKEGDEVIVPVYTYAATANVVVHCGATPVMVDCNSGDFNIDIEKIRAAITEKTKAIIPVDMAGMPCDYDALNKLVIESKNKFVANSAEQKMLGRILIISDAAHSFGGTLNGKRCGSLTDATAFSFHAVKNFTTAEGGAVCLNLPAPFSNEEIATSLRIKSLHGQNKDALAKSKKGNWEYDIVEAGYKCNLTDVCAAIGLAEIKTYDSETLSRRKKIMEMYAAAFSKCSWAELPVFEDEKRKSSYHLYLLRIKNISETQRNEIIQKIFNRDVSVNVHFKPLPLLSFYKNAGCDIKNYPVAYDNYSREISLPVYFDLTDENVKTVIDAVVKSVEEVI